MFIGDGVSPQIDVAREAPTCRALNKFLTIGRTSGYQLPGIPSDKHFIGVSGGADSSALAILLCRLFPEQKFELVFTDTGVEIDGTEEALLQIEKFTGRKIKRIGEAGGLFGLVEHFGGLLPSATKRYCTRILKTEKTEDYLEALRETNPVTFHNYAGLRSDEPGRSGLKSEFDWLQTHFPLRDLGVTRHDVFQILDETIGIPRFYRQRSRSGCAVCFFMRPSEILAVHETNPQQVNSAQRYEKLSQHDADRFAISGADFSRARGFYPIPWFVDVRDNGQVEAQDFATASIKRKINTGHDLFARNRVFLFAAVEYFCDPGMAMFDPQFGHGVWHSQLIAWGTDKPGLIRKINTQYEARLNTAEVFGISADGLRQQYRVAVFALDLSDAAIDLAGLSEPGFCWRMDEPLSKIKKVAHAIKKTLLFVGALQDLKQYEHATPDSWEAEQFEHSLLQAKKMRQEDPNIGRLVKVYSYTPSVAKTALREEGPAPCFVCSR